MPLRDHLTLELGPFVITPFLNDHSAFDTYSLLVEAERKRLFYSADLQAHGRKSSRLEAFLRNRPRGVDVLLLEGTNLHADGDPKRGLTERELEEQLVRVIHDAPGIALAMYPAQNIDRLVMRLPSEMTRDLPSFLWEKESNAGVRYVTRSVICDVCCGGLAGQWAAR